MFFSLNFPSDCRSFLHNKIRGTWNPSSFIPPAPSPQEDTSTHLNSEVRSMEAPEAIFVEIFSGQKKKSFRVTFPETISFSPS